VNYNISPVPGEQYVAAGSLLVLNATPLTIGCYTLSCPPQVWANLTFLAWTGSGAGSANTTANLTTVRVDGPITETASFRYNGYCSAIEVPAPGVACVGASDPLQFREAGLPAGTPWSVTTWTPGAPGGLPVTNTTTASLLTVAEPGFSAPTDYLPWSCGPSVFAGKSCIVASTPASPVEVPQTTNVSVSYSASASAPPGPFPLLVAATGLPNSTTPWTVSLNGTLYPESSTDALFSQGAGTVLLAPSAVYPSPGTECTVAQIELRNLTVGSTWRTVLAPSARFVVSGPTMAIVVYNTSYEVTVAAGTGGTATPVNPVWTPSGGTVRIAATPHSGYTFIGWSGTGGGAYGGGSETQNLTIYTPVTELAIFRPPAPTLDTLAISETGIPSSVPYTVFLNGTGFTGNGSFSLLLAPGRISVAVAATYLGNGSLTRYDPNGTRTSGAVQPVDGGIVLSGSGGLEVLFQAQYGLQLLVAGPGSTVPSPGVIWADAGDTIALEAVAAAHASFDGWNGSVTGSATSLSVPMTGPANETAEFEAVPAAPPRTYDVEFTETGLPSGVAWTAILGGQGITSAGAIPLRGLNGSYPLEVPTTYAAVDTRYVPSASLPSTLDVTSNMTVPVTFRTEYRLTVVNGTGGTVSPGSGWVAAGSRVTLGATPSGGWAFRNWTGTPYEGTAPAPTLTINGPAVELAAFDPPASPAPGGASGILWVLPAALFVVGLVAALVVARQRRRG
jgi:hypothetical protein